MRIWGKLFQDNRMLRDMTVSIEDEDTRTHKVLRALEEICRTWNLNVPIWLEMNIRDFQRYKKTRFTQDSFVGEEIAFDFLELQVLEED